MNIEYNKTVKPNIKADIDSANPPITNKFRKQLTDQLKTLFSAGLILFWASTIKVTTVKRESWKDWAIGSIVLFIVLMVWPKKILWPKFRWLIALLAVLVLWIMYYISGINLNNYRILVYIGGLVLIWSFFLFIILIISLANNNLERKVEGTFKNIFNRLDLAYWEMSIMVIIVSIVSSWTRLYNSGMKGWWMFPILIFGILIAFIVALIPLFSNNRE